MFFSTEQPIQLIYRYERGCLVKPPVLLRIFQILTSGTAVFAVLHLIYIIVQYYYGDWFTAVPLELHILLNGAIWGIVLAIEIIICVVFSKHIKKGYVTTNS